MHIARTILMTMAALILPGSVLAQSTTASLRAELLGHFNESMRKIVALAEAMPAERYDWAPAEGVMPVGQVFGHIARYNYYYPASSMGFAPPAGMRLDTLEAMRDKAQVVQLLKRSADHVRGMLSEMPLEQLEKSTRLYGNDVPHWAVVLQLVAHMNEHLGQSIAYARSNGVVPPWSR